MAFCNAREIGLRFVHFEGNLPSIFSPTSWAAQIKFDSIFKTFDVYICIHIYIHSELNMYAILPLCL